MISYRAQLFKIGYLKQQAVSYRDDFFLAPHSLRATMRSMDFPGKFWEAVPSKELDREWTSEIQGCAMVTDNQWFLVSNDKENKNLYLYDEENDKIIQTWNLLFVPPPDPLLPGFKFFHFGSIIVKGKDVYIDHWCDKAGGQVLHLNYKGGDLLSFVKWIPLELIHGRVGMIAINFERNVIIAAGGELNIKQVYLYSLDDGRYLNKTLILDPSINDACYAQGGFWSPNNHLYISSGQGGIGNSSKGHQYIYCYSPLNGKQKYQVPVTTDAGRQELEGCCYNEMVRQ